MSCPGPLNTWLYLLSLILLLWGSVTIAEERSPDAPAAASPAEPTLLARVNGTPVTEAQVRRRLQSIHGNLDASIQAPARWQRHTLPPGRSLRGFDWPGYGNVFPVVYRCHNADFPGIHRAALHR